MIDFLKQFFAGEKTAAEQALARPRDVMILDAYAMDAEQDDETAGGCGTQRGGCGGCGCG